VSTVPLPSYTGERIVPVLTPNTVFQEHEQRYNFAADFVRGKTVLDVASGSGLGSDFLLRSGALKVIGVDIDGAAVEYASEHYPRITFLHGDASQSISLHENSVDVVVSFETIEHLCDQENFLSECRRVLKPDGSFICSTPNYQLGKWGPPNEFHVKELDAREFINLVKSHFQRNVRVFSQNCVNYPKWVARAMARRAADAVGIKPALKKLADLLALQQRASERERFESGPHGLIPYRWHPIKSPVFLVFVGQKLKG
jgi:2-polyprenyl-3-methyl-5-hydroxy-6-metoxy-1,4-benzoquinol methylase